MRKQYSSVSSFHFSNQNYVWVVLLQCTEMTSHIIRGDENLKEREEGLWSEVYYLQYYLFWNWELNPMSMNTTRSQEEMGCPYQLEGNAFFFANAQILIPSKEMWRAKKNILQYRSNHIADINEGLSTPRVFNKILIIYFSISYTVSNPKHKLA